MRQRRLALLSCVVVAGLLAVRPGVAPAGVEEQRKRLPPPAHDCDDPVTGVWMGHEYLNGYWYRFTLHIDRAAPESPELTGQIVSHSWDTSPEESAPPPCVGGSSHQEAIIEMPAEGRFENNAVSFTGTSWEVREVICGRRPGAYYPDGFSGSLEQQGTEFQSMSDDGHNPVVPVVFRRIKCNEIDRPLPELPEATPPPRYSSGCGGCF